MLLPLLLAGTLATPAIAVEPRPTLVMEWGGYGSALGQMINPYKPAIGPDGLIYVPELTNNRVQVFDLQGRAIRTLGSYGDGPGQLNSPTAVAVGPTGDVYVVDDANDRIQVFSQSGVFLRSMGGAASGPFHLVGIDGIAVDDSGFVYVGQSFEVKRFASDGTFSGYCMQGLPDDITGLGLDVGRRLMYLLMRGKVFKFTFDGTYLAEWWLPSSSRFPCDVGVAPAGDIYVVDRGSSLVFRCAPTGMLLTQWGFNDGDVYSPSGIEVDQLGDIYIAEGFWNGPPNVVGSHTISKWSYSPTPTLKTTWGRIKAMYR